MHYHSLFQQLLAIEHRNRMYEVSALFYASQFFCTNNVPRPLAISYFSTAFSYCVDAGYHRCVNPKTLNSLTAIYLITSRSTRSKEK
jgi:hypothetical protein